MGGIFVKPSSLEGFFSAKSGELVILQGGMFEEGTYRVAGYVVDHSERSVRISHHEPDRPFPFGVRPILSGDKTYSLEYFNMYYVIGRDLRVQVMTPPHND